MTSDPEPGRAAGHPSCTLISTFQQEVASLFSLGERLERVESPEPAPSRRQGETHETTIVSSRRGPRAARHEPDLPHRGYRGLLRAVQGRLQFDPDGYGGLPGTLLPGVRRPLRAGGWRSARVRFGLRPTAALRKLRWAEAIEARPHGDAGSSLSLRRAGRHCPGGGVDVA